MFNYSPMKNIKHLIDGLDRRLQETVNSLVNLGGRTSALEGRVSVVEKSFASSEVQRWQTGQIREMQERIKELEKRTTPPIGLEPETPRRKNGGRNWKGGTTPGTLTDDVMQFVRDKKRTTTAEVAAAFGVSSDKASKILCQQVRRGLLTSDGRGVYTVPSKRLTARAVGKHG